MFLQQLQEEHSFFKETKPIFVDKSKSVSLCSRPL
jgi:hypothetical protein